MKTQKIHSAAQQPPHLQLTRRGRRSRIETGALGRRARRAIGGVLLPAVKIRVIFAFVVVVVVDSDGAALGMLKLPQIRRRPRCRRCRARPCPGCRGPHCRRRLARAERQLWRRFACRPTHQRIRALQKRVIIILSALIDRVQLVHQRQLRLLGLRGLKRGRKDEGMRMF